MNAIYLCLVLSSCQNVEVVDIEPGHFAYRDLKTVSRPQECFVRRNNDLTCKDMDWNHYRGLAQFFGKVSPTK